MSVSWWKWQYRSATGGFVQEPGGSTLTFCENKRSVCSSLVLGQFVEAMMTARNRIKAVLTLAAVAMLGLGTSANAEVITVDGYDHWQSTTSTITGTFDASGSDKLVVIVTGEHGFNNDQGACTAVTYDGVALTEVINRDAQVATTDTIYNDMWILDSPATSTGEIIASVVNRGNVTVFALSGTEDGVGATAISLVNTRSVDLTTTADDSLVIASFGMGGAGNTANVTSVDPDAPLFETSAQENGNNWDGHVTAYVQVPTAGAGTYSFTGGNVSGAHVIAAEFLAIPEPATMGLLALGGLVLLRRRRA